MIDDKKLSKVLIIPDTHRPFHHVKAYNLMLEVAKFIGVTHIYILGDYADFYSVSSHGKDPRIFSMLQNEVIDVLWGLEDLDKVFPKAKKVYIEGNHEFRLERYITNQAPALFGLTSVKHIFDMNRRPLWEWISYGATQLTSVAGSFLNARHEPLSSSAKASAAKALCSLVYGHIHRIEESHIVGVNGINHVNFSVGWLGDKRKDEVFGYVKNTPQWQLGFGLVYVDPDTRLFYHSKIHILEVDNQISCVVNGKRFVG